MSSERPPESPAALAERLRHFVPFRSLSAEEAEELASLATVVEAPTDDNVVHEGEEMDALFLVLEGSLAEFRDTVGHPVVLLRRLYPGDMFGHVALYSNGRHVSTFRANEQSQLLRIERRDLLDFLEGQAAVRTAIETLAAQRHSSNLAAEIHVERGREVRMRLHQKVRLGLEDGTSCDAYLENLSLGGFCLQDPPASWEEDSVVHFTLGLGIGNLDLAGRVAWKRDNGVGIQFTEMKANHDLVIQMAIRLLLESHTQPVGG